MRWWWHHFRWVGHLNPRWRGTSKQIPEGVGVGGYISVSWGKGEQQVHKIGDGKVVGIFRGTMQR